MGRWVSGTTSTELVSFDFLGDDVWFDEITNDQYNKDESGMWWVDCSCDGDEYGPFNTLEQACECMVEVYRKWAV